MPIEFINPNSLPLNNAQVANAAERNIAGSKAPKEVNPTSEDPQEVYVQAELTGEEATATRPTDKTSTADDEQITEAALLEGEQESVLELKQKTKKRQDSFNFSSTVEGLLSGDNSSSESSSQQVSAELSAIPTGKDLALRFEVTARLEELKELANSKIANTYAEMGATIGENPSIEATKALEIVREMRLEPAEYSAPKDVVFMLDSSNSEKPFACDWAEPIAGKFALPAFQPFGVAA